MRVAECTKESAQTPADVSAVPSHWRGRSDYTVFDSAFDAGANFLALWQAWRDAGGRPSRLHYLAFVPRFYSVAALEAIHRRWPQWAALSQVLREHWPCAVPGMHRLLLPDAEVSLTFVLGDRQDLAQIDVRIDTFLVDGDFFSRDAKHLRHDLAWLSRLAAQQAQMILPEGAIDHAMLQAAGFNTEGRLASFAPRWQVPSSPEVARRAIVIGAGLAGAAVAQRLCARGWQVDLIERHTAPATEASGNLAGIFMPVLARDDNPLVRFSRAAFLFALRLWRELGGIGSAFDGAQCGVLQLSDDISTRDYPAEFARAVERGWWFAQGGWINPASLCRALLDACGTRLARQFATEVGAIERDSESWRVVDEHGALLAQAPHLVLANGAQGNGFAQTAHLPLSPIRGQVTHIAASQLPALSMAICGDGYITPAHQGICNLGATYDHDGDTSLRADSQHSNLVRLATLLPGAVSNPDALPLQGRTGFRTVAPDRLPLIGQLPDQSALAASRAERLRDVPRHAGLYALLGLASRGLTWSSLAAELLAAQMSQEPSPLERDVCATLDPARFALQQHRAAKNIIGHSS